MPKRDVLGILLLDKPSGISSSAALSRVRGIFAAAKGGHTGALDPLATGLLPICLGEATKYADYFLKGDKLYEAVGRLGQTTDTCDGEGQVIKTAPVGDAIQRLPLILQTFTGRIVQVPPLYSAVKVGGRPLYRYARAGRGSEVEIPSREVTIHELKLVETTPDSFKITVYCSKGTYIRTLVNDLGEALGCGAYVTSLRRLRIAGLPEKPMVGLDDLQEICDSRSDPQDFTLLDSYLCSLDECLKDLPEVTLPTESAAALLHGMRQGPDFTGCSFRDCSPDTEGSVQVRWQGKFIGIASLVRGMLVPERMMSLKRVGL